MIKQSFFYIILRELYIISICVRINISGTTSMKYNIVPTMNLPNQFSLLTEIEYYKRDNIRKQSEFLSVSKNEVCEEIITRIHFFRFESIIKNEMFKIIFFGYGYEIIIGIYTRLLHYNFSTLNIIIPILNFNIRSKINNSLFSQHTSH